MTISAHDNEPFAFYMPPSVILRAIPLAYVAVVLLGASYIPFTVGLARLSAGFRNHPALWWEVLFFVASIALMLWFAFPPRDAQARLEVRRDSVSFIPSRSDQSFLGKQIVAAAVTPQSRDILFCHSVFEGMPDGFKLIVRSTDEPEREVKVTFPFILDAQECRNIAEGTAAATGLPVRLVTRRLTGGSVQESPWIPIAPKANIARGLATVAVGAIPFIGGITAGYLLPRPAVIMAVGLALWLVQLLAISACARWLHYTPAKHSILYSLTTLFPFGAAYGLAVVLVAFVIHSA